MNKWIGIGRLTRDAEVRYSQGENTTAIARFTLAVDRRIKRDGVQTSLTVLLLVRQQSLLRSTHIKVQSL